MQEIKRQTGYDKATILARAPNKNRRVRSRLSD